MLVAEVISEAKERGFVRSVEEGREDLEAMGIDTELFAVPAGTKSIFALVPQSYEDEGGSLPEIGDIPKEDSVCFVFDSNREAVVWKTEEGYLLWVSSDGKAEEGFLFYEI